MSDFIDRQAAIDAVIKHLQLDHKYAWGVREAINALPSAQQWIPCSDGMPDEDRCTGKGIQYSSEVLATVINHRADDETFVDMMLTVDGEWKTVHPIDGDNNIADWCEVVAWMPLPKPYEVDSNGRT